MKVVSVGGSRVCSSKTLVGDRELTGGGAVCADPIVEGKNLRR